MRKKSKISQEDINTFAEAVKGVKPLRQKEKIRLAQAVRTRSRRKSEQDETDEEMLKFSEGAYLEKVGGEEFISFQQPGISNKTLRKLRKGQYNVEAILDLHGKSVEEAVTVLNSFLQQCLREEIRVVLIIHGKGHHSRMPILKNKLNHWLREINMVLAFCSAAPPHGSRGAMYVMLRRKTEENLD